MFDEPVNGLDPDGIRWVRNLLKGLAREGRTVFVSSHLMSEMALTADEVVIIGKGRLIAQVPIDELLAQSSQRYRPRALARDRKSSRRPSSARGPRRPSARTDRSRCAASTRWRSASSRPSIPVVLHELAPQSASLEEAFMELTEESVEYHGAQTTGSAVHGKGAK